MRNITRSELQHAISATFREKESHILPVKEWDIEMVFDRLLVHLEEITRKEVKNENIHS